MYEIGLYEGMDCYNYGYIMYEYGYDAGLSIYNKKLIKAAEDIGFIIHRLPITTMACWKVYNDTLYFKETIENFDPVVFGINVTLNVFMNFAEIYNQLNKSSSALSSGKYETFGVAVGKLTSDILIKNPFSKDWTLNNSDIFNSDIPSSSFYDNVPLL